MIALTQIPPNSPAFCTVQCGTLCIANRQIALFKLFLNSIPLVFYTFRTSYVHLQEDYILRAVLCVMVFHVMVCYVIHSEITIIIVIST
jgi:hypothetical protein